MKAVTSGLYAHCATPATTSRQSPKTHLARLMTWSSRWRVEKEGSSSPRTVISDNWSSQRGTPTVGVVLLRFPSSARAVLPSAVVEFVTGREAQLAGRFIVMEPGRVRISGHLRPIDPP